MQLCFVFNSISNTHRSGCPCGKGGGQGGGKNGSVSINYNDLKTETRPSL